MKTLKIGDLLARLPIIQGGMGVGISLSGLASAVANQGGVGVISSAGLGVIYRVILLPFFAGVAVIKLFVCCCLCFGA